MKKPKITELLIFIVATELVGALSGLLAGNSFSFYKELIKPPLSPPGWLFPNAKEKCPAFIIYGTQLFVNFMWSIVFFRFKMLRLSVAVILTLLGLIIAMIIIFHRIRPSAAYLNIPYLLWILFASYLNIGILLLN